LAGEPTTKIVRCCHCRGMMKVPARAFSVFCPHCQKRAPLENLRIVGSHPGKSLATCGDITIESTAKLNLSIIANNVTVHGRVSGNVSASQVVVVGSTGQVVGDIAAAKIIVQDGGMITGKCSMAGRQTPEPGGAGTIAAGQVGPSTSEPAGGAPERPAATPRPLPLPPKGLWSAPAR
jgi:cytoskeletal protein CcmA (bactofilin family)